MTDGVIRSPFVFGMMTGCPFFSSMTATAEKVVPRSIPTLIPMFITFLF